MLVRPEENLDLTIVENIDWFLRESVEFHPAVRSTHLKLHAH